MRSWVPGVLLVVLLACAGCGNDAPASPRQTPTTSPTKTPLSKQAIVRYVYDGDTIQVRYPNGRVARVRLLGMDAPEDTTTVDCGGPEATAVLRRLLPVGTVVRLDGDANEADHDKYGRDLRYVDRAGRDIDLVLVRRGRAKVYTYSRPPFTRVDAYRDAEAKARAAGKGLWGSC